MMPDVRQIPLLIIRLELDKLLLRERNAEVISSIENIKKNAERMASFITDRTIDDMLITRCMFLFLYAASKAASQMEYGFIYNYVPNMSADAQIIANGMIEELGHIIKQDNMYLMAVERMQRQFAVRYERFAEMCEKRAYNNLLTFSKKAPSLALTDTSSQADGLEKELQKAQKFSSQVVDFCKKYRIS